MFSTFAFCLICGVGGLLVWLHRPGSVGKLIDHGVWLSLFLPAAVAVLFWIGSNEGHGQRLTLDVAEMRIPFSDAKADGTYMIFGPRSEISDFIIGPYADAQQSREVYRTDFDSLLTVKRTRGDWKVCGNIVKPDAETSLPGMRTTFGDDKTAFGDCRSISTKATRIGIDRQDSADKNVERRHFLLSRKADHISIVLPPTQKLSQVAGNCADIGKDQVARLAPAGLHAPDRGYRIPDNLVFMQLSQGAANPLLKPSALGSIGTIKELCAAAPHSFSWPSAKGSERLILSSRTVSIGRWIVLLLFTASILTWWFCRSHWREAEGRVEAALVLGLQWLLALRLVIAQAGLFNDESLSQAAILWPPAIAFVVMPLIAIAILRGGDSDERAPLFGLALFVPFTMLLIWWGVDSVSPGLKEILLAVAAIALLVARRIVAMPQSFLAASVSTTAGRVNSLWLGGKRGSVQQAVDYWSLGAILCLIMVLMRLLMLALGFKERFTGLPVIDNLPFSMAYAPLSIVAMALMIVGFRAKPTLARAIGLVTAFSVLLIVVGMAVRDFGMIWIYAWPMGVAIAALVWVKPQQGGLGRLLARAVLLFPVISPVLAAFVYISFVIPSVPSPKSDLAGHIEAAAKWDRTAARLQRYIDPQRLAEAGSTASFEMLEHAAQLEPITGNFWGKGYLAPSGIVNPLLNYQYDDNVLAVHIAWPFGRLGLTVYLAALFAILLALWTPRAGDGAGGRAGWRGEAARLAAMTFFWSSAYMALANLNLVPFTGRNAYLLAAKSEGDLAEGFLLLLLVALPLVTIGAKAKAAR